MNKEEFNQKLGRLQEIIAEARKIISSLEEFCKENNELAYTPVASLAIAQGGLQTKYLNVCSNAGIKNIQQLMDVGYNNFKKYRNCGKMTADLVRKALWEQYHIEW